MREDSLESHLSPLIPLSTFWTIMYQYPKHTQSPFLLFRCFYKQLLLSIIHKQLLLSISLHPKPVHVLASKSRHIRKTTATVMPALTHNLLPFHLHPLPLLLGAAQTLQSYVVISQEASLSRRLYKCFFSPPTLFLRKKSAVLPSLDPVRKILQHQTALALQDGLKLVHNTNDNSMCFPVRNLVSMQYVQTISL